MQNEEQRVAPPSVRPDLETYRTRVARAMDQYKAGNPPPLSFLDTYAEDMSALLGLLDSTERARTWAVEANNDLLARARTAEADNGVLVDTLRKIMALASPKHGDHVQIYCLAAEAAVTDHPGAGLLEILEQAQIGMIERERELRSLTATAKQLVKDKEDAIQALLAQLQDADIRRQDAERQRAEACRDLDRRITEEATRLAALTRYVDEVAREIRTRCATLALSHCDGTKTGVNNALAEDIADAILRDGDSAGRPKGIERLALPGPMEDR